MENVFTGKTVEEAVETGLKELGASREDVEVEILEEGKKKLFGSKPAQVKLTVKEKLTDGERAVRFLEGLMPLLGDRTGRRIGKGHHRQTRRDHRRGADPGGRRRKHGQKGI